METLSAVVEVAFEMKNHHQWELVSSGRGQFAGLEIVGDTGVLV